MTTLGPFYFHYRYSRGPQVASEPDSVAAGPLYTGTPHGAETLRPRDEALVTLRGRRHRQLSQASAQLVQSYSHVQVEVRVHAQNYPGDRKSTRLNSSHANIS